MDIGHPIGKRSMHPERFREDLARAIQLGFCGSFQERRELALTMYTDGEIWCCWTWLGVMSQLRSSFIWNMGGKGRCCTMCSYHESCQGRPAGLLRQLPGAPGARPHHVHRR